MKVEEQPLDFFNLLYSSEKAISHIDCLKKQEKTSIKHILIDFKKQALKIDFIDQLRYLVTTHKSNLAKIIIYNFDHQKFFDDKQFLFKFKHFTGLDKIRFLTVPENYHLFESYLCDMLTDKCCDNCDGFGIEPTYFANSH